MAEFPALPLFTDAYLADTRHLTAAQHGAYLLLLMMAWRSADCALPNNDKILARYASMTDKEWLASKEIILAFWRLQDFNGTTKLVQLRLLDERKYVEDNSKRQSKNARARWLKNKETPHATAMPNECQMNAPTPTPHPHPTSLELSKDNSNKKAIKNTFDDEFESFWALYPKKTGKEAARKAYQKARKGTDYDTIIRGVNDYINANPWRGEKQFCKHPATWLNGGHWSDEHEVASNNATPAKPAGSGRPSPTSYERSIMAALAAGQRHEGDEPN